MSKCKAIFEIYVCGEVGMVITEATTVDDEESIIISRIFKDVRQENQYITVKDKEEYNCMMDSLQHLGDKFDWSRP